MDLEKIMEQKLQSNKGDSGNIDLAELYDVLIETRDKPLSETYPSIYAGRRFKRQINKLIHFSVTSEPTKAFF